MNDKIGEFRSEQTRKNRMLVYLLIIPVIIVMFVFAYMQVPLFRIFCQKIGFGQSPLTQVDEGGTGRMVKVLYTGVVAGDLPVYFKPKESIQTVEVGKPFENSYHFVNMSDDSVFFRPVHSILPEDAAKKFNMTKCFCFDDQAFGPREEKTFEIVSVLDKEMKESVKQVTLHYTLFEKNPATMESGRNIPNIAESKAGTK